MGRYKNPTIRDEENLRNTSKLLKKLNPHMIVEDYRKILLENAREGDSGGLVVKNDLIMSSCNFSLESVCT